MKTILDAIAEELAILRLRINCLERAQALIAPAYGLPALNAKPQEPGSAGPRQSRRRDRNHSPKSASREEIRDHVVRHGPLGRSDLVKALGGDPTGISQKLKRLLDAGEIGADGPSGSRLYRASEKFDIESTLATIRQTAHTTLPERGVYPVYDAILDLGGASNQQLQAHTGLPKDIVVEQCRRLVRLGLIWCKRVGNTRIWRPADVDAKRGAS